jgi:hypothetical protein
MNIVGKTVMVMLFGETLDGHEKPAIEIVTPLGVDSVANPVAAALALLQRENIITTDQAIVIAGKSRDELSRGLAAIAQ